VNRGGVGLPAQVFGAADDGVEPVSHVQGVEHRIGEVVLAVRDDADRRL